MAAPDVVGNVENIEVGRFLANHLNLDLASVTARLNDTTTVGKYLRTPRNSKGATASPLLPRTEPLKGGDAQNDELGVGGPEKYHNL